MVSDFSKKRKSDFWKNKVWFQLAAGIFAIIVIALLFIDFSIYKKRKELNSQVDFYKKQIENLEKNSQNLKDQIANADNIDYLEKIAYEQLGEQKPGEKGVIFITPEKQNEENSKTENTWTGWISGAWDWIKSKF